MHITKLNREQLLYNIQMFNLETQFSRWKDQHQQREKQANISVYIHYKIIYTSCHTSNLYLIWKICTCGLPEKQQQHLEIY